MRRMLMVIGLVVVVGSSGCSSSDGVRSDSGPDVNGAATSEAFDPENPDSTTATTEGAAAAASTSPFVAVVGTVDVPEGDPGELSVVLTGTFEADSGTLPVVVRNRTSDPVYAVEATATARAADGSLAGSGSSQGFGPTTLAPGEWAFGYVFIDGDIPADATFDITTTAEEDGGFIGSIDGTEAEGRGVGVGV